MVILHIAYVDDRKSSGPNINVPKNVNYGNKYENVALYNLSKLDPPVKINNNKYFSVRDYEDYTDLPEPFNNPDIVVFQNLYIYKMYKISRKLVKKGIPYIIVPRCAMTASAQSDKRIKKKFANILFFNRYVSNANSIHFLTENEYLESKKVFRFKKHFVVGNGVELPTKKNTPKTRGELKIVFIGRYALHHKGLDMLLEVIRENHKWFEKNNISFNLYGSNFDNGLEYMTNYIDNNKIGSVVKVNEPVFDKAKEKVLLDADLFIHVSRTEGQPTSVIEAISYGIPVIVTPGTNILDEVRNNNLGFTCEFDKNSIYNCIKKAYENKNLFDSISNNEILYSKNNFNWDMVVKRTIDYYKLESMRK